MLKNLICSIAIASLFLFPLTAFSQNKLKTEQVAAIDNLTKKSEIAPHIKIDKRTGSVASIKSKVKAGIGGDPKGEALSFLKNHKKLFGISDESKELRLKSEKTDKNRNSHIKFQQVYDGIIVDGFEVILHINEDGYVEFVNGKIIPNLSINTAPAIDREQSIILANKSLKKEIYLDNFPKSIELENEKNNDTFITLSSELRIFDAGLASNGPVDVHLAWKIVLSQENPPGEWIYFVNAHSGEILLHYNNIKNSLDRKTYTANNLLTLPGELVINEGEWSSDPVVQKAHDNFGLTYDYFSNVFNRDSFDNSGSTIVNTVHLGKQYNNAFWNGNQFAFGDGDGVLFGPFGDALDIVAHEFSHAVTQYEANLDYVTESGALNESFSDIFGELTELYHGEGTTGEWLLGEDAKTPAIQGDALRSMIDPPMHGQPDHYFDIIRSPTSIDAGGVHFNSGIMNKAAYLIADGGTFNSYAINGIGSENTANLFYSVLSNYLISSSNYADLAESLQQASESMFGAGSTEHDTVISTIEAIGLGYDSDGDQIPDSYETDTGVYNVFTRKNDTGTDPNSADSDNDGINDGDEIIFYRTNPLSLDSDGDGVNDYDEVTVTKTDPTIINGLPDSGWENEQIIFQNPPTATGAFAPRMAGDGNGNIFAVMFVSDGLFYQLQLIRYTLADGWSAPELLSPADSNPVFPIVAVDENGNAIVAWKNFLGDTSLEIWARNYDIGTEEWSDPVWIEGGSFMETFDIAMKNGKGVVAWRDKSADSGLQEWSAYFDKANGWSAPQRINAQDCEGTSDICVDFPEVAIDDSGNATAVWSQFDYAGNHWEVLTSRSLSGGSWSPPQRLSADNVNAYTRLGQFTWSDNGGSWLDMDSSGNALAVWYQHDDPNYNVYAAQFDGVAWGNSYRLDPDNTGMAFEPRLAMSANGQAAAVWSQNDGEGLFYKTRLYIPENGWGPPESLAMDQLSRAGRSHSHAVSINSAGNVALTWIQSDYHFGTDNMWAKRYSTHNGWEPDTLIESSLLNVEYSQFAPFAGIYYMYPQVAIDRYSNVVTIWPQEDKDRGGGVWNVASNRTDVILPPVAENQQVSTKMNKSVVIELEAEDPDGDPLTYICVDLPDNGTLSGCDDGDEYVTYTPDKQFTGNDTFTFQAYDGELYSNEATVTVKVTKGGGGGGNPTDGVVTLQAQPRTNDN